MSLACSAATAASVCSQLDALSVQAAEKRRLHGEKELHARMRVFARYMPQAEHDDLVDALILEQRLQHRIQVRCRSCISS